MKVRFAALLLLLLPMFAVAQTGPRPGDAWNSYTVYTVGNIVTYNGTTYVSLQSNNAVETPSSNPTWWNPIAAAPGSGATAAITGGTIDGAVIGGTTPAAGSFTTVTAGTGTQSTALTVNGNSNSALGGLVNIQDATNTATLNYGINYFSPNLPTGGTIAHVLGKSNSNGNSLVLFWNQTASTTTNNWCIAMWGQGANCTLQGFYDYTLKSKNNTLDDGSGNMAIAGSIGPTTLNGDITATPSRFQQVTSTNSGATAGIPSGFGCAVTHTFVSGASYTAVAYCADASTHQYLYMSPSLALGSEAYVQQWRITNGAGIDQISTIGASKSFNASSPITTVSCSTSGSAAFDQPFQGSSYKQVMVHLAACVGTASYTYPTAFTNSPSVYASNNVAASIATSVSTTAVTVTGATTTGSLVLEDY